MQNLEGEKLLISEITDDAEKIAYGKWMNAFRPLVYPNIGYLMTGETMTDTFSMHLREFHKQ
jgi:hypothetical protein